MTIPACELNTLREFLGQAGLKGLSDRYGLEALFASKNRS